MYPVQRYYTNCHWIHYMTCYCKYILYKKSMIFDNCQWWLHLKPLELGFPFPIVCCLEGDPRVSRMY